MELVPTAAQGRPEMASKITADDIITQINRTPLAVDVEKYLGNFGTLILRSVVDLMGTDATDMPRKECVEFILSETFDSVDPMIFDQGIEAESGHNGDQDSEPTVPATEKPVTSRFTQARLEASVWAESYSTRLKTAQKDGDIWAVANSECESAEHKLVQLLMDSPDDGSRELLMEHILMNNAYTFLRAYNGYEL